MKILLIGHTCSPELGSEPGFTWNWAHALSQHHEVDVISHPQYREHTERRLAECPNPNLRIHWVEVPRLLDPWNPAHGGRGLTLHYPLWLRYAFDTARRLHASAPFAVVHHITMGTVSVASPFWKLSLPCIWGPLGGGQVTPPGLLTLFRGGRMMERIRTARIRSLRYMPSVRQSARGYTMALATNDESASVLRGLGSRDVRLLLDSGTRKDWLVEEPLARSAGNRLTLAWCGRLHPSKGLALGFEALAAVSDLQIELLVAGDGGQKEELARRVRELGLGDRVRFLGRISQDEVMSLFRKVDALLFTSIRDSFGSVVLDAMSMSLPILTLDHQGVGAFVPPSAGIKVKVSDHSGTVRALAAGMAAMADSVERRARMGRAAWEFARQQTWEARAIEMTRLYEESLSRRPLLSRGLGMQLAGPGAVGN